MPLVVGILNLTSDSFSDGGRFLDPDAAIAHGREMRAGGADWIDVGAESSSPKGAPVEPAAQIRRLDPVIRALAADGTRVSIDTHRPAVLSAAIAAGATMANDVTGLADPGCIEILQASTIPVVVMHARNVGYRAEVASPSGSALERAIEWLRRRVDDLDRAGIAAARIVVDPGMGLFLSKEAAPSLEVLRGLARLKTDVGRPVYVSTSRKSFVGSVLGGRPPADRAAGTLATEIWAATQGVDWVRTHDPRALRDALAVWAAIAGS